MFSKVLVANRGEIACRVIQTCQKLGIKTAAIYSDADERALHVRMADEAVRVGPPSAIESYLKTDAIIKAARRVKAEAIHPGYGFLSENASFARAVERAGLTFIGPSPEVIRQMGDKVAARRLAKEAGVPVIPGTEGEVADAEVVQVAGEVGFPLMIKAADGGGGMGIRVVHEEGELLQAAARARAQAQGAFGSSRIYIERRVEHASHVEVQVMGDRHENVIHLFERDCSVQRRNQKVIEETPCAKISPEVREELTSAAVRLAQSIGYSNAGTVEFLLDRDHQRFYFLEMNTRLQVEHPVTEMVTGVDLVELQLRSAAGEELPLRQEDITLNGAAIEARIYPEDPEVLLPRAGKVLSIIEPRGSHIRIDGALYVGYEVQPYYEPMMAKLIVSGPDRHQAIVNMQHALYDYVIEGVVTNIPLIQRVLAHQRFAQASYDTTFLEELVREPQGGGKELIAAIAVALVRRQEQTSRLMPSKWKMHNRRMAMVTRLGNGVG